MAIILSVGTYRDATNNLPACVADAELMSSILTGTEKYKEVLSLTGAMPSAKVKEALVEFVTRHRGTQPVDEVFFYYTGHGEMHGNEYYYLLSDYESAKRKQTSLENSELDNLLRSLVPKVAIKVIDACYSGVSYVKDSDSFAKYFDSSKAGFNSCYFMFSSQADQKSYQDAKLSFFTRSFARSIQFHKSDEIRYKDILDYISDDFQADADQKPFFVIQGDYTEKFSRLTLKLRTSATETSSKADAGKTDPGHTSTKPSLVSLVQTEASDYFSKEDAVKAIGQLKEYAVGYAYPPEFKDLYTVEVDLTTDTKPSFPRIAAVGEWLAKNKHNYFVTVLRQAENYTERVPVSSVGGFGSFEMDPETGQFGQKMRTVTKTRDRITGIEFPRDSPSHVLRVLAHPKYDNLPWANCSVICIVSKTELRFFYFFANYNELGWDSRVLPGDVNWQTYPTKLKENRTAFERVLADFSLFVMTPIKEKFLPKTEDSNVATTTEPPVKSESPKHTA